MMSKNGRAIVLFVMMISVVSAHAMDEGNVEKHGANNSDSVAMDIACLHSAARLGDQNGQKEVESDTFYSMGDALRELILGKDKWEASNGVLILSQAVSLVNDGSDLAVYEMQQKVWHEGEFGVRK